MDIVITYVNGQDPQWRDDYQRYVGESLLQKRYRDWGTLPFLLRGIEECMPFVENVFLVVSRESQVPSWIDRNQVRVVLHRDFIPQQYLPTFNASAIEMFIHRIAGLGEQFLYFNDDCFPVMPCQPSDFFREGKAAAYMQYHLFTFGNLFRRFTQASDRFARKAAGAGYSFGYVRPQHTCTPMLRDVCQELYERHEQEILASVTPLRKPYNYNQYLFTDYAYFTGHTFKRRISNRHLSLSIATLGKISQSVLRPRHSIVCINDVDMSDERFARLQAGILCTFRERFPRKSRYEL